MAMLDDIAPNPVRGVVAIGEDCPHCKRPVPVFGKVGKGRSLDTFDPGYFCRGHAITAK